MFTIYGISGPIFQGTLESLSRLPPVVRRGPVNAIRRTNAQDPTGLTGGEFIGPPPSGIGTQAISAYQSMLPKELERGPLLHANQIMLTRVITLNADDDVANAWHTLVDNQIHQAPVLDTGMRLTGIVSERNLLTTLNVDDGAVRDVLQKKVRDVMTTPVVAAYPLTDIRQIAHVMLDRDVDGVPITNESGTLVGFISRSDILRAVVTDPPLSIWR
jgi:CBS domain-containing protein